MILVWPCQPNFLGTCHQPYNGTVQGPNKPNKFFWYENLDTDCVKSGVAFLTPTKKHVSLTDWSRNGIGYLLLQQHCSCESKVPRFCKDGWKIIQAGSIFTNNAKLGYTLHLRAKHQQYHGVYIILVCSLRVALNGLLQQITSHYWLSSTIKYRSRCIIQVPHHFTFLLSINFQPERTLNRMGTST